MCRAFVECLVYELALSDPGYWKLLKLWRMESLKGAPLPPPPLTITKTFVSIFTIIIHVHFTRLHMFHFFSKVCNSDHSTTFSIPMDIYRWKTESNE